MISVRDRFVFYSDNGMDYTIEVINVNNYREPSMRYACEVCDGNGVYASDVMFFSEDFLNNCERID